MGLGQLIPSSSSTSVRVFVAPALTMDVRPLLVPREPHLAHHVCL